jgi:hypothetical protein
MVRKSSMFAKTSKCGSNISYDVPDSRSASLGSGGSEFRDRGGSQSSEDNSTSSSGENIRYLFPSSSADDLRGHGPVKRPGLVLFDDHEGGTSELDYYYGIVKRHILRHQSIINGLFPSHSSEKNIGSVRDTIYSCMAAWSLHLAYRQHDDDKGKAYELGQAVVMGMQGILVCWMRQSKHLENFKHKQGKEESLHTLFMASKCEDVFTNMIILDMIRQGSNDTVCFLKNFNNHNIFCNQSFGITIHENHGEKIFNVCQNFKMW